MKLSYDPEVAALNIVFRESTATAKTLAAGIAADYDAAGRLAGLEVLDAVRRSGDQATMQWVVLEGFAENISELRERPDQEFGVGGPAGSRRNGRQGGRTTPAIQVPSGGGCPWQAPKGPCMAPCL
jgi:hypothetical protein